MAPEAPPVIEITRSGEALLTVWADGRIVWSGDTQSGGSPQQSARIDPDAVARTIAAIRTSPLLHGRWIGETRTGPDAATTMVRVRDGDDLIVDVGSWHEAFEADPRLVVTAAGVQPLGDRSRDAVLAEHPADYRTFRQRWDEVVGRLRRLVPSSGRMP